MKTVQNSEKGYEMEFNINDKVTFKHCSKEFQENNYFTINFIKKFYHEVEIDGEKEIIESICCSEDNRTWYPEKELILRKDL